MKTIILALLLIGILIPRSLSYLQVKGKDFYYHDQKVYLSGVNIAWNHYDNDWGNGQYFKTRQNLDNWIEQISKNGGNTARVWLHVEGSQSPKWDKDGFVTGTDNGNSLIQEMGAFLDVAASNNVFIIFCLWNGAVMNHQNVVNLIWDENKLKTYIDHALVPMVKGLHGKKALAGWEIMNEPAGIVSITHDAEHCFDTTKFQGHAGWLKKNIPMKTVLRFINWQADAIHNADPEALVTNGAQTHRFTTDKCHGCVNYYTNDCLHKAGGRNRGTLDFYQMHTYEWDNESPINVNADYYGLDKPVIIGEYSARLSKSKNPVTNAEHYYNSGYNGALSWQYNDHHDEAMDSRDDQNRGMHSIINHKDHGVIKVNINQ